MLRPADDDGTEKEWLTVAEFALAYGVSVAQVYVLINRGKFRSSGLRCAQRSKTTAYRIRRSELLRFQDLKRQGLPV